MNRLVEPEILDSLAFDDPRAIRNRSELRIINRIMGNYRWFAHEMKKQPRPGPQSILELGAGDGSMGLYLRQTQAVDESSCYCGVDLIPKPELWPTNWQWWQKDLKQIEPGAQYRSLLANLILHHFTDKELRSLGGVIEASSIDRIYMCEPLRRKIHLWQIQFTRLIGMSSITLHDAQVSVRAGFRKLEVCTALGLNPDRWQCHFNDTFLGANRVICRRK